MSSHIRNDNKKPFSGIFCNLGEPHFVVSASVVYQDYGGIPPFTIAFIE